MKNGFAGKVALVTGVSSGIGRELARQLSEAGARVHGVDLGEDPGIEGMTFRSMDVVDPEGWRSLVEGLERGEGGIDYLFNNAGVSLLGEAHKVPFERWKWLLDINVMGPVHGIQAVYPGMVRRGSGHIVSTASIAGITGYATSAPYTASKGFVIGLSQSLAAEARAYGVKVSVACPGYVRTAIFTQDKVYGADLKRVIDELPAPMMEPAEAARKLLKGVAKGKERIVFPANARLLVFLAAWAPWAVGLLQKKLLAPFRS